MKIEDHKEQSRADIFHELLRFNSILRKLQAHWRIVFYQIKIKSNTFHHIWKPALCIKNVKVDQLK
jgi:hypothetical protein